MKRNKLIIAIAVVLCSAMLGCGKEIVDPVIEPVITTQSTTISGTVIDLDTGDPIQQATVTLSPSGRNTYTGYDGHFEFLDLDARQYTITVQKTGYLTNRKTVIVYWRASRSKNSKCPS